MRLSPLILFALLVLFAQAMEPAGANVEVFGRELPHLCPAAHAGEQCLGCGTTRATLHLLHGEFTTAWSAKPLVFLLPLVFLFEAFAPSIGRRRVRIGRNLLALGVVTLAVLPVVLT
ncbi:MAG: DUF2752 domain-containing protein [Planctomycetes bacterium]|nr:DUF2752 domain-containing protein [Planctomycetota bacterium]